MKSDPVLQCRKKLVTKEGDLKGYGTIWLSRSIVNQSSTITDNIMTDNTIKDIPTYDRAIRNMKSRTTNILRGANRYGVLEDSDDDNEVQNVRFADVRE